MGVDLQIYRCMVDVFNGGLGPKCLCVSIARNSATVRDVAFGVMSASTVCFIGALLVMSGIEQNPGPPGTHHMNDPLFKNWVRAAYGFKYLKSGLTGFVSNQLCLRHKDLKQMVAQQCTNVQPCTVCTSSNLMPDHGSNGCNQRNKGNCFCRQGRHRRRTCPNNFCGRFYHLIVDDHVENSPRWSSTDPTKWYNDFFHYAKCFLGTHSTVNSLSDLDCTGLLSIVIHNRYIHNSIDSIDPFKQCRSDRNTIFHTGNFKLTDSELAGFIDNMVSVLGDRKCLINDQSAQQAIKSLCELKTNNIHISDEDIVGIVQDATRAINELGDVIKQDIENKRQQILNESTDVSANIIREVNKRGSEVIQEVDEHTEAAVSEIKRQKHEATSEISELKDAIRQNEVSDIRDLLRKRYLHDCFSLQVSPLLKGKGVPFLDLYKKPSMCHVEYHREQSKPSDKPITSYENTFRKEQQSCRNIYITGVAGVGKTSFCRRMCLMWCKSQGDDLNIDCDEWQADIEYMKEFELVFYLSLRDTEHYHIVDMIEQLCLKYHDKKIIQEVLRKNHCLIIMDGFDEWNPKIDGRKKYEVPERIYSKKCVYLTTCRPYKIERVRLSTEDIDKQIQMTGIIGDSLMSYVQDVINYLNRENLDNRNSINFIDEIAKCQLEDQLCIPIIASQLVGLWFEKESLTGMSRAIIYANILDMLFKNAEDRMVDLPSTSASELNLTESLSELMHFKTHISLLQKICSFSFTLLFKQDETVSSLVFTADQLLAKPFNISLSEIEFLCKVGIVSKNKVTGCFLKQKLSISFLHKSYLEFLAELFVSLFDTNNLFDGVTQKWKSLNDLLQFENFFLFLAGLSFQKVQSVFEAIYPLISEDFSLVRRNAIVHYISYVYREKLKSLQTLAINCIKESKRSGEGNTYIKLEDFILDDDSNVEILKELLMLNREGVKSIHSDNGKYIDVFDPIKDLHCLRICKALPADFVEFTHLMMQNNSSLDTVSITGSFQLFSIKAIPLRSLHFLTSLSLAWLKLHHKSIHYLVEYLCEHVLMQKIELEHLSCEDHRDTGGNIDSDSDCALTLHLPNHTKLTSLRLYSVNLLCSAVNNTSLKHITLRPFSERNALCYNDVFSCIEDSHLEYLKIEAAYLNYSTKKSLTCSVRTLSCIKSLSLFYVDLLEDILFHVHPDITDASIYLYNVSMSRECFHSFIESFVNNKTVIKVRLFKIKITIVDGETHRWLYGKESLDYISEYLASIPTIHITYKGVYKNGYLLHFETTLSQ